MTSYGTVPHIDGAVDGVPAPKGEAVRRDTNQEVHVACWDGVDSAQKQLAPTGLILELPLPPSVNRMMAKLGNRSPAIVKWTRLADGYTYQQKRWINQHKITGPFRIHITWTKAEQGKSDIDNRIKPLLDYLQRIGVIENDKMCRVMTVSYGETNYGCRVELRGI